MSVKSLIPEIIGENQKKPAAGLCFDIIDRHTEHISNFTDD